MKAKVKYAWDVDQQVHKLIHNLLVMGEPDPSKLYEIHHRSMMESHQELIIAVKDRIKPGLVALVSRPFTVLMIKDYLRELKTKYKLVNHASNNHDLCDGNDEESCATQRGQPPIIKLE